MPGLYNANDHSSIVKLAESNPERVTA